MKVYLAGPMRGHALSNFPAFLGAAELLRRAGYEVADPAAHDLEMGFNPAREDALDGFDIKAALRWDLEQVLASDAVVVMGGWENSRGANAEVATARAVDVPVLTLEDALRAPVDGSGE